jgi:hypothetical protein
MARRPEDAAKLTAGRGWQRVNGKAENLLWTDDFINLLRVLGR